MKNIKSLWKRGLVEGLPKLKYDKDEICKACQMSKQSRISFSPKNEVSTSKPLELLHMDLYGPSDIMSLGGKKYVYVIVDDFSRFTWIILLATKDEAFPMFVNFSKLVQNEKQSSIISIRSDHGGEFENKRFIDFCDEKGIHHTFSAPRTPQQNGVVERKNRTIQEMARTMLNEIKLSKKF